MALAPIQLISDFMEDYPNYWLKFYEQGTTTPLAMAIDKLGAVTVAKAEISAGPTPPLGLIKTAGNVTFIPYVDDAYDAYIFPTEAEADANDTVNAIQLADDVDYLQQLPTQVAGTLVASMIANTSLAIGDFVDTVGYAVAGDDGDNSYEIVAGSTGTDDGGSFINLDNGFQAKGLFPLGVVSIAQFGAIGDGNSANKALNLTAITNALTFNSDVLVPPGVFAVELSVTPAITPLANATLYGVSKASSKIIIVTTDTTARSFFKIDGGNFIFKDIGLTVDAPAAATVLIFSPQSDNIRIKDSEFDGGNTSGNANEVMFLNFGDVDTDGLFVTGCDIHNMQRVILRDTARTGLITNVEFSNNDIHDLGQGGVQFNCPGFTAKNIRILGNHFETFHSGTERIFSGGASINGITIQGNTYSGIGTECVHLEEDVSNASITGNEFLINGRGISLFTNNVGGSAEFPREITITGNNFVDGSGARNNIGINAPITAVGGSLGLDSYEDLIISDNTFRGYDVAIKTGRTPAKITDNAIKNCDFGVESIVVWPEVYNNVFDNVATAILSAQGGMVGSNFFRRPLVIADSTDGSRISMNGFRLSLEADVNLPATTTTNIPLGITVGAEMYGQSKVMVYMDSPTLFHHRISLTDYDGATFSDTEEMRNGSGAVSFVELLNSGGQLAISLNNTSGAAETLTHLSIEFDGMWVSNS